MGQMTYFIFEPPSLGIQKNQNSYVNLSGLRDSMVWDFLLGYPKIMKFRNCQGSLTWNFFVMKLQEVFSEHGIRVFIENGLGSFQAFLILQI
jgi:hypothetical protein